MDSISTDHVFRIDRSTFGMVFILGLLAVILWMKSAYPMLWDYDRYANFNTYISGNNFAEYGFIHLRFLPVQQYKPLPETPDYYLHFPPLPEIINGVFQSMGITSLQMMRLFSGILWITGLFFMACGLRIIFEPLTVLCCLAWIPLTMFFYAFSGSIHHHPYNVFFLGLYLWTFLRGIHGQGHTVRNWLICWIALMLASLASFEFILYCFVLAWGYIILTGNTRRFWYVALCLSIAPIVGVGLHFLQNCWAIGWESAWQDGMGIHKRAGELTAANRWQALFALPKFLTTYTRYHYNFSWSCTLFLSLGIIIYHYFKSERKVTPRTAFHIMVLVASATWFLAIPAHAVIHHHTVNQFFLWNLLIYGECMALILIYFRKAGPGLKLLIGISLVLMIGNQGRYVADALQHCDFNQRITLRQAIMDDAFIAQAIGPDNFPEKTAILYYGDVPANYIRYMLQRPTLQIEHTVEEIPITFNQFRHDLPEHWSIAFLLFYDRDTDRIKDRHVLQYLAEHYQGRVKTMDFPDRKSPIDVMYFDLTIEPPVPSATNFPKQFDYEAIVSQFEQWQIDDFEHNLQNCLTP